MTAGEPIAWLDGQIATELVDSTDDLEALTSSGRWAVVIGFEGEVRCHRFANWVPGHPQEVAQPWQGPGRADYKSSLDQFQYQAAVAAVRCDIELGRLYQANICRILSAPLPDPERCDILGLASLLSHGNPSPFAGAIRIPAENLEIATASPELFLRQDGRRVWSGPIKGTAPDSAGLTEKDRAENVMIVDLVRNDLGRVAVPSSVEVPSLLRVEEHPTVTHLVSTVSATLAAEKNLPSAIRAAFPPGSVTGAPKYTALQVIAELETAERGPYCGAIGWVDADRSTAELAVAIRTFWKSGTTDQPRLNFGTGAGITWGSDASAEWDESVLKAAHLVSVASGKWK